jgi:MFS family permease
VGITISGATALLGMKGGDLIAARSSRRSGDSDIDQGKLQGGLSLIARRIVLCLGVSQLICWGVSYYLIGVFGDAIVGDFGWSRDIVYGGFSLALLATGLSSPFVGRWIDRRGGRDVMTIGSVAMAAGLIGLAASRGLVSYYGAWIVIGVAMRLTLYDTAFAALARIGGPEAKQPISQITLLGGLASTILWPIGEGLAHWFGWRGAVLCYAAFALLTVPLHMAIPHGRYGETATAASEKRQPPQAATKADRLFAGVLYALIATVANILNSGMSAHMIGILSGLGLAASASVWVATMRGVGQSLSRGGEVLFGGRLNPLTLNLLASLLLPLAFVAGLFSANSAIAALAFAFCYGAANGVLTITRGTLPLVLFDHRTYGAFVGRLLVPSFLLSAGAPVAYAFIIERFGAAAALYCSIFLALAATAAAIALSARFGATRTPDVKDGPTAVR